MPADDQAPATCPTCGGPAVTDGICEIYTGNSESGPLSERYPTFSQTLYRTLADPARMRAMTELLTTELEQIRVDDEDGYVDYGDFADWWEKVRALLTPQEAP